MTTSLPKLLFSSTEFIYIFVLFQCIKLNPLRLLLKNSLLAYVLGNTQSDTLKILVLQYSLWTIGYSAAVGLLRDEYFSIDSIRSTAYIEAFGNKSAKFTPFS